MTNEGRKSAGSRPEAAKWITCWLDKGSSARQSRFRHLPGGQAQGEAAVGADADGIVRQG